jgi:hypothetical protein
VGWIHLAQDTNRWRALVTTVMNLRVPKKGGEFLDQLNALSASQKGLRITRLSVTHLETDSFAQILNVLGEDSYLEVHLKCRGNEMVLS